VRGGGANSRFMRRVHEYIEQNRPKEATVSAQKFGNRYTYKHTERFSAAYPVIEVVKGFKRIGSTVGTKLKKEGKKSGNKEIYAAGEMFEKYWNFLSDTLIPFVAGVGNLIEKGMEYTSYGYVKGAAYAGYALKERIQGKKDSDYDFQRAGEYAFRAAVGQLMMALIMGMIDDDEDGEKAIYGTGSENIGEKINRSNQRPENTVMINGAKVPINAFGPWGFMLRKKGYELDRERYEANKAAYNMAFLAAMYGDTYLETTANVVKYAKDAITKEDDKAKQFAMRQSAEIMTRTMIPFTSALRQAEQIVDPVAKKPLTFMNHLEKQSGLLFGWVNGSPKAVDFMGREYDTGDMYTGGADGFRKMAQKAKPISEGEKLVLKYNPAITRLSQNEADLQLPDENYVYRPIGASDYFEVTSNSAKKFGKMIDLWAETYPEQTTIPKESEFTPTRESDYSKEARKKIKDEGGDPTNEQLVSLTANIMFNEDRMAQAIKEDITAINSLAKNAAIEEYYLSRNMPVPADKVGSRLMYETKILSLGGTP
jgi:hypothetical protein